MLYRVYFRDCSWGVDPLEKFHIKSYDLLEANEVDARSAFMEFDPDGFFDILACEQLPPDHIPAFDVDYAFMYIITGVVTSKAITKPKNEPVIPPEVWNKKKIDADKAMQAVRDMSKGHGF